MEIYSTRSFNQDLLSRTQLLAGRIYEHLSTKRESQLGKCPIQELIRCSSSVAARFRSATRADSYAEFYSKVCRAAAECDETLFWLDFLIGVKVLDYEDVSEIRKEAVELVEIFSTIRVKIRYRVELGILMDK